MSYGGLPRRRPDQVVRPSVPLQPGGSPATLADLTALGLAKDASVHGLQSGGIPPTVAGVQSAGELTVGPGEYPLHTFTYTGQLWVVQLSYAVASTSTFGTSTPQFYARVYAQIGGFDVTLGTIELVLAAASETENDSVVVPLQGFPVPAGDGIALDVNNGNNVANVVQRCSCTVLYLDTA